MVETTAITPSFQGVVQTFAVFDQVTKDLRQNVISAGQVHAMGAFDLELKCQSIQRIST